MIARATLLLALLSDIALAAPIMQLKLLYPQTPICVGGQARAVIVAPEALSVVAQGLSGQIKTRYGVQLEIVRPEQVVSAEWQLSPAAADDRGLGAVGSGRDSGRREVLGGGG